eukprot:g2412.t1
MVILRNAWEDKDHLKDSSSCHEPSYVARHAGVTGKIGSRTNRDPKAWEKRTTIPGFTGYRPGKNQADQVTPKITEQNVSSLRRGGKFAWDVTSKVTTKRSPEEIEAERVSFAKLPTAGERSRLTYQGGLIDREKEEIENARSWSKVPKDKYNPRDGTFFQMCDKDSRKHREKPETIGWDCIESESMLNSLARDASHLDRSMTPGNTDAAEHPHTYVPAKGRRRDFIDHVAPNSTVSANDSRLKTLILDDDGDEEKVKAAGVPSHRLQFHPQNIQGRLKTVTERTGALGKESGAGPTSNQMRYGVNNVIVPDIGCNNESAFTFDNYKEEHHAFREYFKGKLYAKYKNQESKVGEGTAFRQPPYAEKAHLSNIVPPAGHIIRAYKNHESSILENVEPHERSLRHLKGSTNVESAQEPHSRPQYGLEKRYINEEKFYRITELSKDYVGGKKNTENDKRGDDDKKHMGKTRWVKNEKSGRSEFRPPGIHDPKQGQHRTQRKWSYHNQESRDMTLGHGPDEFPLEKMNFELPSYENYDEFYTTRWRGKNYTPKAQRIQEETGQAIWRGLTRQLLSSDYDLSKAILNCGVFSPVLQECLSNKVKKTHMIDLDTFIDVPNTFAALQLVNSNVFLESRSTKNDGVLSPSTTDSDLFRHDLRSILPEKMEKDDAFKKEVGGVDNSPHLGLDDIFKLKLRRRQTGSEEKVNDNLIIQNQNENSSDELSKLNDQIEEEKQEEIQAAAMSHLAHVLKLHAKCITKEPSKETLRKEAKTLSGLSSGFKGRKEPLTQAMNNLISTLVDCGREESLSIICELIGYKGSECSEWPATFFVNPRVVPQEGLPVSSMKNKSLETAAISVILPGRTVTGVAASEDYVRILVKDEKEAWIRQKETIATTNEEEKKIIFYLIREKNKIPDLPRRVMCMEQFAPCKLYRKSNMNQYILLNWELSAWEEVLATASNQNWLLVRRINRYPNFNDDSPNYQTVENGGGWIKIDDTVDLPMPNGVCRGEGNSTEFCNKDSDCTHGGVCVIGGKCLRNGAVTCTKAKDCAAFGAVIEPLAPCTIKGRCTRGGEECLLDSECNETAALNSLLSARSNHEEETSLSDGYRISEIPQGAGNSSSFEEGKSIDIENHYRAVIMKQSVDSGVQPKCHRTGGLCDNPANEKLVCSNDSDCPSLRCISPRGICNPDPSQSCDSDSECKENGDQTSICLVEGYCQIKKNQRCLSASTCPDRSLCILGGRCSNDLTVRCETQEHCENGKCLHRGRCSLQSEYLCNTDKDCGKKGPCALLSVCFRDKSIICRSDEDCKEGKCLHQGVCKLNVERACGNDDHCQKGPCIPNLNEIDDTEKKTFEDKKLKEKISEKRREIEMMDLQKADNEREQMNDITSNPNHHSKEKILEQDEGKMPGEMKKGDSQLESKSSNEETKGDRKEGDSQLESESSNEETKAEENPSNVKEEKRGENQSKLNETSKEEEQLNDKKTEDQSVVPIVEGKPTIKAKEKENKDSPSKDDKQKDDNGKNNENVKKSMPSGTKTNPNALKLPTLPSLPSLPSLPDLSMKAGLNLGGPGAALFAALNGMSPGEAAGNEMLQKMLGLLGGLAAKAAAAAAAAQEKANAAMLAAQAALLKAQEAAQLAASATLKNAPLLNAEAQHAAQVAEKAKKDADDAKKASEEATQNAKKAKEILNVTAAEIKAKQAKGMNDKKDKNDNETKEEDMKVKDEDTKVETSKDEDTKIETSKDEAKEKEDLKQHAAPKCEAAVIKNEPPFRAIEILFDHPVQSNSKNGGLDPAFWHILADSKDCTSLEADAPVITNKGRAVRIFISSKDPSDCSLDGRFRPDTNVTISYEPGSDSDDGILQGRKHKQFVKAFQNFDVKNEVKIIPVNPTGVDGKKQFEDVANIVVASGGDEPPPLKEPETKLKQASGGGVWKKENIVLPVDDDEEEEENVKMEKQLEEMGRLEEERLLNHFHQSNNESESMLQKIVHVQQYKQNSTKTMEKEPFI